MLVLTRKKGQSIKIGEDIVITILENRPDGVRIGVEAPKNVTVLRSELVEEVKQANLDAININIDALKDLGSFFNKKS